MQTEKTYSSKSSIDRPPNGKDAPEQEELFDSDEHDEDVDNFLASQRPDSWKFELTLTLAPKKGKGTHKVPVCSGCAYGDRIEELLEKGMDSLYFKERLRSIIGEPLPELAAQTDIEESMI